MKRRTVKRILTGATYHRAAFAASCASALLYVLLPAWAGVLGRAIDNIPRPGAGGPTRRAGTIWRC